MEPPVTRDMLYEVFGSRALRWGLFYANERALRFELSMSGGHLEQFEGAWDRGREILDVVFRETERVAVVLSWIVEEPSPLRYVSVFRALRAWSGRTTRGRRRARWTGAMRSACSSSSARGET